MSAEWITIRLHEVASIRNGAGIKQESFSDVGIPLVRVTNFTDTSVELKDCVKVSVEHAPKWKGHQLKCGDILVATVGSWPPNWSSVVGKSVRVPATAVGSIQNQNTCCIQANPNLADQRFLYYLTRSAHFGIYAANSASGSANQARLPVVKLEAYEFALPPLLEQISIGQMLGAFDDRIALLRETNATLEAMAQALFKSWFVDFDPVHANAGTRAATLPPELQALFPSTFTDTPQGLVPEGWRVVSFTETINVIGGGTPKTSIPEYWGGDIPWFSVVDAPATTNVFVISTEKQITEQGLNNSSTKLLPAGTTIISARGTVGRLALVGCDMAMNQSCYGLRGKYGDDYFTYFTTCRLVEALKQRSHGSVFDTITRDTLAGVSVIYPDYSVVAAFEDAVSAVMEKIKNNLQQAQTLAKLRDTLLPRLISGQLRLPDAAAALAEAGA